MSARTYYEILGVKPDAPREQIQRAYRAAARRLHPDQNTAPDAEARFKEVAQAYETLRDAGKRRVYDARLAAPPAPASSHPGEPHYSWTNVASAGDSVAWADEERRERRTELDEMYDAFYAKKPAAARRKKPKRDAS